MSAESKVYVVDDEPAVRDSLRTLLATYGFAVETYGSGPEFLEHVSGEKPGCLVADVRMPGMSGLELQGELTRRWSAASAWRWTASGASARAATRRSA